MINKTVFILVGMPGSGKSTIAKKIAKKTKAKHLSSDEIRNRLFRSVQYDPNGDLAVQKISGKIYETLYENSLKLLLKNKKVIVDATHLNPKKRKMAIKILSEGAKKNEMCFVVLSTPTEIIEKRMKEKVGEMANETENYYEAWKRVTSYFLEKLKNGILTWPTEAEDIDCFDHKELAYELAK